MRFFSFKPTVPACHAQHIYAAGHLHRLQRVIRRALVGSATESFMAALEGRGYSFRMIGRRKRLVKRRIHFLMYMVRYISMLVQVSLDSLSRPRRFCVSHGMEGLGHARIRVLY